jgi:hypothetical protein
MNDNEATTQIVFYQGVVEDVVEEEVEAFLITECQVSDDF